MDSFSGSFDELKSVVEKTGLTGNWADLANSGQCFRASSGEILNWWPRSKKVTVQGSNQEQFKAMLASGDFSAPHRTVTEDPKRNIFVVHGHDATSRDQLELILMRLDLKPFILQNQDGEGLTIIEALEKNIYGRSGFGIILLTPDDYGYSKLSGETERQSRARQNVILEMGMVLAALGRDKVAILQKGALERPSDTDGILRMEFNDHVREVVPKLAQRLQAAGFTISADKIAKASA